MRTIAAGLATLCFYAFFYRLVLKRAGSLVRGVLAPLRLETRHPARDVEAVGKLAAAAVAQLLFALALMVLLGIGPGEIVGFNPHLVLVGIALGVGELALAALLCSVVFNLARPASGGTVRQEWLGGARSGWMRYFIATTAVAPPWLAAATIGLYVGVEELVFRGILITAASTHGAIAACSFSAALFVAVQVFGMPSARAAIVPVIGAAVIGPVHGVLFWHVHDVVPLVAAHLAYFAGALLVAQRLRLGTPAAAFP